MELTDSFSISQNSRKLNKVGGGEIVVKGSRNEDLQRYHLEEGSFKKIYIYIAKLTVSGSIVHSQTIIQDNGKKRKASTGSYVSLEVSSSNCSLSKFTFGFSWLFTYLMIKQSADKISIQPKKNLYIIKQSFWELIKQQKGKLPS